MQWTRDEIYLTGITRCVEENLIFRSNEKEEMKVYVFSEIFLQIYPPRRADFNKMSTLVSKYILCFKFQKQRLGIGLLQDQLARLNVTIN